MAAFRKMTGVHSNDSLQYNSGSESSDEELDCRMSTLSLKIVMLTQVQAAIFNQELEALLTSHLNILLTQIRIFLLCNSNFALKTGVWDIYLHGLKSMLGGVPHDFIRQEYKRVH